MVATTTPSTLLFTTKMETKSTAKTTPSTTTIKKIIPKTESKILTNKELVTSSTIIWKQVPKCWSKFEYENNVYEIKVDVGKYISFPCSFQSDFFAGINSKSVQGSHLYKCEIDGNLYKINSTCRLKLFKSEWLNYLNQEVFIYFFLLNQKKKIQIFLTNLVDNK